MVIENRRTGANTGKCILDLGDRYRVETWENGLIVKAELFTDADAAWEAYRR